MPKKDFLSIQLRELPYFRALIRAMEAAFYQDLEMPAPVLDIGCGDGHFASRTFDTQLDIGLDPWHTPIREARKYGAYRFLVEADAAYSPFTDGYFSSAISNSVQEHIPHIDAVLSETARVLKPDAPFYFCVPNPRYLSELSLSRLFGKGYTDWFQRISRVHHADGPEVWVPRLERAGFRVERWWHYFPPAAMRVLEWGHYFGLPSWITKQLTGRWILAPGKWNLWLTDKLIRPYARAEPVEDGTFTFYVARRK